MGLTTIFLLFIGALLCFLILYLLARNDKKKAMSFYDVYTMNGLKLVKKLESMFENNETLPFVGEIHLYKSIFTDLNEINIDEFEKVVGINGYLDKPENSPKYIAGDYLTMLAGDLAQRHQSQFSQLKSINESEAMEKFGLNINSNEFIHDSIKSVDWFEEKTITTSYSYGGFQSRTNIGNGLSYKMGNLSVVPLSAQKFIKIDRGTIYITNQRIIFVGAEKRVNKSIDLDDLIEFSIYKDGILFGKSNGKKPLIQFPEYIIKPNNAPNKRDHLNRTIRVIDRVIRKNQNIEIEQN